MKPRNMSLLVKSVIARSDPTFFSRSDLGKLLSIALLVVLSGTIFQTASAIQCVRFAPAEYYERSDIIFVGSVIEIERNSRFLEDGHYVTLNVSKSWKGVDTKMVTVHSEGGRFREIGAELLVNADKNALAIEVTFCGGTIGTGSDVFVKDELAFLESQPSIELRQGHLVSMNPLPVLGFIGLVLALGAAAVGVFKSGITIVMLSNAFPYMAALFLGLLFIAIISNITFPASPICSAKPLDHIEKLSRISVMVPTVLPEGYSFQGGSIDMRDQIFSLKYFTQPVCAYGYEWSTLDGLILVSGSPLENERIIDILNMTSSEYLDQLMSEDRPGRISQLRVSFPDGREAFGFSESTFGARQDTQVLIADEKTDTWYAITSNRSLEEAIAIAESLKARN